MNGRWGRVLGLLLGLAFARLPGAILGFVVGWWFDRALAKDFQGAGFGRYWQSLSNADMDDLFFHTTFAVMGHLAKAKGRVDENDIALASALMDKLSLTGSRRQAAQEAFREGKSPAYPLDVAVSQLKEQLGHEPELLQLFLEIQIALALADNKLQKGERLVLLRVVRALGMPDKALAAMIRMAKAGQGFSGPPEQSRPARLNEAYATLGLPADADMNAVKRAYRKAMAEHHPDKLVAKGLPADMQQLAKERAQAIQAAYQLIKSQHRD